MGGETPGHCFVTYHANFPSFQPVIGETLLSHLLQTSHSFYAVRLFYAVQMKPSMPPYRQQYTLLACILVLFLFLVPTSMFGQFTQWDGSTSSSWRDSTNWNSGIPNSGKSAKIYTDSSIYPAHVPIPLGNDTASTLNLDILSKGVLRFDSLGVLVVYGTKLDIQPQGKLYLGYGTLISRGSITFFNAGSFDAGAGTLEFSGVTWNNKSGSTFDGGTSTVIFSGSGDQFFYDSSGIGVTFYNLEINTQGTVSITGNVTVTNSISVAEGCTLDVAASSFTLSDSCETTFNGTVTGGAFPVQMTSFAATANRLDAILRWATATEVNNFGFEIERRTVQGSMFQVQGSGTLNIEPGTWNRVGFVQGAGTSTSPKEYSFLDANLPAGRYAYRVKQIDFGGAAAYYDAAEVEVGLAPKELSLGPNYPNPFNPTTTIEFTLPEAGKASLKVFNMIGQQVATLFDQNAEAGRLYRATFSASSLPSGLYFYRLEFANRSIVKRMTLVK